MKYTAAVLDENGRGPNPARDKRVRLPREDRDELTPPSAEHVVAVVELLPERLRLLLLWLDWSGALIEIARFVGQRKLPPTADTCTHVLVLAPRRVGQVCRRGGQHHGRQRAEHGIDSASIEAELAPRGRLS